MLILLIYFFGFFLDQLVITIRAVARQEGSACQESTNINKGGRISEKLENSREDFENEKSNYFSRT